TLFVFIDGGYHGRAVAVGRGKHWLFFEGWGHPDLPAALRLPAVRGGSEGNDLRAGGREQLESAIDKKGCGALPRSMAGMTSRPIFATRKLDPGGRHHVLVSQDSGGAALSRLLAQMPPGTDARILYVGDSPPAVAGLRLFPTEAELLAELDRILSGCVMGTRLYVAGSERFLGSALRAGLEYNLNRDQGQCQPRGR